MSSRNHTQHSPGDRSRRRKAVAVIVIGAVVLVGWIVAIAVFAGQSPPAGSEQGSGGEQQAPTPDESGQPAGDSGAGNTPAAGGDSPSSGPSEQELEDVADEALSPPPGGGAPPGEVPIEDEEGRSNGQRGFVSTFIGAAYGYTGEDVEEYRAGYENRIDTSTYYDSAGGQVLEEYAAMVEDGGAENAAILKDYRITSGEPVETQVNATEIEQFAPQQVMKQEIPPDATVSEVTYAVGDRYGDPSKDEDFGEVYGNVDYLKQRLFLSRAEGQGWKIIAASAPAPTEKPKTLDPDAPKVGEPQGPGIPDHGHDH